MYFLALSHAPPPLLSSVATRMPAIVPTMRNAATDSAPTANIRKIIAAAIGTPTAIAPGTTDLAAVLAAYRAACERSADRAALLLGGDPAVIVALAAARGDRPAHLISAIAQPGWLPLRARLGLGVR